MAEARPTPAIPDQAMLRRRGIATLVVSGAKTDVSVLGTVDRVSGGGRDGCGLLVGGPDP